MHRVYAYNCHHSPHDCITIFNQVLLFVCTNLVIEKSNIATKMKTESDEHNATNNMLNAFLMSGLDKMKILRAFPTKPKMPKID